MEIRKNAIDVSELAYVASDFVVDDMIGASVDDFVGLERYGRDAQLLVTRGCPWHTDPYHGPMTALLILRSKCIKIRSWGLGSVVPGPGDVILFDAHRKHCAKSVGGSPVLVAIGVDLPYGSTMDDAIERLNMEIE